MNKGELVKEIADKLSKMNINFQLGDGSDITIAAEFIDAGWSTGNKKITYSASVFADEAANTVYMWEMTKEIGSGFSFGGDSSSSFQSGTTLFRKVKSVQYGIDGKAYEYTLNLGEIPKAAKESAKQFGWKFKTVIKKDKALWPAGYTPNYLSSSTVPLAVDMVTPMQKEAGLFCTSCGGKITPEAKFCPLCGASKANTVPEPKKELAQIQQKEQIPQQAAPFAMAQGSRNDNSPGNPNAQFYSSGQNKKCSISSSLGLIAFLILGVVMLVLLIAGKTTAVGWALSVVVFAAAFIIQRKLSKKGCLLNIVLWIVTVFVLLMVFGLTAQTDASKPEKSTNSVVCDSLGTRILMM